MSQQINFKISFNTAARMYALTFGQISLPYARHLLSLLPSITSTSTIHDNASGPGIVTLEILSLYRPYPFSPRPTLYATDFSEAMIAGLQETLSTTEQWARCVHASVQDSEHLTFADNSFSHSLMNFGLMITKHPDIAAREIYRTTKPGGCAGITTFKVNGFLDLIHRTQAAIRPDLPKLAIYEPEWIEERKLRETLVEAGFGEEKVRIEEWEEQWSTEIVMKVLMSDFTAGAREGYTDEEKGRWGSVASECLTEKERETGMVRMVGWVAVAEK